MNQAKTYRAIEQGLVALMWARSEADSEHSKKSLNQSFCLICDVGDSWFAKVQEVFTHEGIDPLFVIATLGALEVVSKTHSNGTKRFNPIRFGPFGKMVITHNDCHGCVSAKVFLDTLALIWPDE